MVNWIALPCFRFFRRCGEKESWIQFSLALFGYGGEGNQNGVLSSSKYPGFFGRAMISKANFGSKSDAGYLCECPTRVYVASEEKPLGPCRRLAPLFKAQ